MSRSKRRSKSSRRRSQHKGSSIGRRLLGIILLLLLLAVLYKGARIGIAAQQTYSSINKLQDVAQSSLASGDIHTMQQAVFNASQSLQGLDSQISPLSPLLRQLSGVTSVGTTLANLPELLNVGKEYLNIADQGIAITGPSLASSVNQPAFIRLAEVAKSSTAELTALAEQADATNALLSELPLAGMIPSISAQLSDIKSFGELLGPILKLAPSFPQLAGIDEPRTYLLLVQNNHELRATGGFITAIGSLRVEKGDIAELNFSDSYKIANNEVDHPWAPEAMQRYLGIDLMFLRDVNWSPDFPTTAQLARTIYGLDEGVYVDGVISVDLNAVQTLMGGIGPIRLPGVEQPISQDNIIEQLKLFWQEGTPGAEETQSQEEDQIQEDGDLDDWWSRRKDFMPLLGEAAITRIKDGNVDYVRLVKAVQKALAERSIQIWVNDPVAAEQLAELDWNGNIRAEFDMDYLALVDNNLGYNKVDHVMQRRIDYEVNWENGSGEPATVKARIRYKHQSQAGSGQRCDITPRYGRSYNDMTDRCYFDYVRLYVPQGSNLLNISGVDANSITSQVGEGNTQVFAGYFTMKPSEEHEVIFQYELPSSITPEAYSLIVRRQAGTDPLSLTIRVGNNTDSRIIEEGTFIWQ